MNEAVKIFFLPLVLLSAILAACGQSAPLSAVAANLQSLLCARIDSLSANGILRGNIEMIPSGWDGIVYLGEKIDGKIGGYGGFIQFAGDSVSGSVVFPYAGDSLTLDISAGFAGDSLQGALALQSKSVYAKIILRTRRSAKGQYGLSLNCELYKLTLSGSLVSLFNNQDALMGMMKAMSGSLGFSTFSLRIKGSGNITFGNVDFTCTAAVDAQINDPGHRKGTVEVQSGSFYKFGRKFTITGGVFDLAAGQIFLAAEYSADAFVASPDSGSVRKHFLVIAEYSGSLPDSAQWNYTSYPALRREQIEYLLVTGSPYAPENSAFFSANLEDRVKNALKYYHPEKYTRFAERQVGKLVAFDRVVIEGNAFSSTGSYYLATKKLGSHLKLRMKGMLGSASDQTIAFEYPLSSRFFLINETNQYGKTGIDLRYVVRFR